MLLVQSHQVSEYTSNPLSLPQKAKLDYGKSVFYLMILCVLTALTQYCTFPYLRTPLAKPVSSWKRYAVCSSRSKQIHLFLSLVKIHACFLGSLYGQKAVPELIPETVLCPTEVLSECCFIDNMPRCDHLPPCCNQVILCQVCHPFAWSSKAQAACGSSSVSKHVPGLHHHYFYSKKLRSF